MVKILDLDKLFDKYISDYVYKNIGKIKPEEIENNIPKMYESFGDEKLSELDDKTPNTYYKDFKSEELLSALKEHLEKDVPVSDFLCEGIIANGGSEKAITEALKKDESEEYTAYLMNMLSDIKGEIPIARYLEFVALDYSDTIGDLATEFLSEEAEKVKEKALLMLKDCSDKARERIIEILSNCKSDDRVFDVLISEFAKHQDKIPQYSQYLTKYGDDRALPFLLKAIEDDKISYADFEELRFSIEALGGEYNKKRDFTGDKTYKKIKEEVKVKTENAE